MEKVEHNRFYSIKLPGKISMFQEKWGQPGRFACKVMDVQILSVCCKVWLYISQSIIGAVESNYMQNDRAGQGSLGI